MSLNTTTNGEIIQTVYVYRYDFHKIEYGRGGMIKHYVGYSSRLTKPKIPKTPSQWNSNHMIEIIKVDTSKMTARPIDDYFHKILFVWNDDTYNTYYNEWREWIRQYEVL